jgi:hypothetical protein
MLLVVCMIAIDPSTPPVTGSFNASIAFQQSSNSDGPAPHFLIPHVASVLCALPPVPVP